MTFLIILFFAGLLFALSMIAAFIVVVASEGKKSKLRIRCLWYLSVVCYALSLMFGLDLKLHKDWVLELAEDERAGKEKLKLSDLEHPSEAELRAYIANSGGAAFRHIAQHVTYCPGCTRKMMEFIG